MRVYRPTVDEGFEWVVAVADADFEVFRSFDGSPRRSGWVPVRVRLLTEDERGQPFEESDFPWLGSHALVLRKRAVDALGSVLADVGELLPLACDDAELWVLNVCRVVDALDEGRSQLVRFGTGRIMKVERHIFRPESVEGQLVFKIPQLLRGSVFMTDDFIHVVTGLRGLGFELVWEDREGRP